MSENATVNESGVMMQESSPDRMDERDEKSPTQHQRSSSIKSKSLEKNEKSYGKIEQGEKEKLNVMKKSFLMTKENSPEIIALTTKNIPQKKSSTIPAHLSELTMPQPINIDLEELSTPHDAKETSQRKQADQEESSADELSELRDHIKHDWWNDEEAGGLPRSESRGSRVSRAVRLLFCCGVPYEGPDEDQISYQRNPAI